MLGVLFLGKNAVVVYSFNPYSEHLKQIEHSKTGHKRRFVAFHILSLAVPVKGHMVPMGCPMSEAE